jgi:hypothetical protein
VVVVVTAQPCPAEKIQNATYSPLYDDDDMLIFLSILQYVKMMMCFDDRIAFHFTSIQHFFLIHLSLQVSLWVFFLLAGQNDVDSH